MCSREIFDSWFRSGKDADVEQADVEINGGISWDRFSISFSYIGITFYTSRRGTKCDCKIDCLWVRSPLEEMKYLFKFIYSFLRSGIEAKRVEFRPSTRNACRIREKVGNEVS